jgi:hypothetical protein
VSGAAFATLRNTFNPTRAALVYIPPMPGAPHILIVDDHREIRDLVSRILDE